MSAIPNPGLHPSQNPEPSPETDEQPPSTLIMSSGSTTPPAKARTRDELRKQLLSARRQLSATQVLEYSSAISDRLRSLIEPSTAVAGYLPLGNEVRIDTLLKTVRQQQCTTYVPIMQRNCQMVFAKIDDQSALLKNNFGILEPDLANAVTIPAGSLDIVLVPLVGFDQECQRMGMGGGYYDRAFEANRLTPDTIKKPRLIGVAYDIQEATSVMPDWWDVPLDLIVTETQIIKNAKGA